MKRMLALSFSVICGSGLVIAQSSATPPGQAEKKGQGGNITLTGCVAAGPSADQFLLTNAVRSGPASKKEVAQEKAAVGDKGMAHPMSYTLMATADVNLKAHMGHKVEVMGTHDSASPGQQKAQAKKEGTPSTPMGGGTVKVASLKMVSATCP